VFASRPVTDSCEHGTEHSDALIGAKADWLIENNSAI
jgi:hypothetical protein